jgi:hypothetical protein
VAVLEVEYFLERPEQSHQYSVRCPKGIIQLVLYRHVLLNQHHFRKLYIANVPKEPSLLQKRRIKLFAKSNKSSSNHQKSFDDFYMGRDFLEDFKTDMLNLSRREDNILICQDTFCCRFRSEYDVLDVAADEVIFQLVVS